MSQATTNAIPNVHLGGFAGQLKKHLPGLLALLKSTALRSHPVWGGLIPCHLPLFGGESSLGHCIRPDVMITEKGPVICELDFVPAGRGCTYLSLPTQEARREFLTTFANWYRGLGFESVLYASATVDETITWGEISAFCQGMQEVLGFNITAANIDRTSLFDGLVDRLYYASEMKPEPRLIIPGGGSIITAEPWLDSKMIFAMIHDQGSTDFLRDNLGEEALDFFRRVFPKSFDLVDLQKNNQAFLEEITAEPGKGQKAERRNWLVKSTNEDSWGSRGVVMGCSYSGNRFREAVLEGKSPKHKDLGSRPLLQRFVPSIDFKEMWDGLVDGRYHRARPEDIGHLADKKTQQPASKHVYGRFGPYLLVNNQTGEVTMTPYGVATLRQDELSHGSKDAILCAVEMTD